LLDHREKAGIDPVVIAPGGGPLAGALEERGIERMDWPVGGRHAATLLCRDLQDRDLHLVHGNSLMVSDAALAVSRELRVPAVAHVRDMMSLSAARWERLASLEMVVAVSRAVADWLRECGVPGDRIARIHNAVDGQALRQAATRGSFRRELGIPEAVPLLGCVGQIALRKGQDIFLEAARKLAVRFPEARFVLAGARYSRKPESREYEAALEARAARPPLGGRTLLLGYREDIPTVLSDLDVVIVPSRQEPLSRVLVEALALGVPAVATDVGGTREILEDGSTGLLVPPEDSGAIADAASRLLTSPELRSGICRRGLRRARGFSPARHVGAIRALYERVLSR
jgi:glycosyltransferase involved in cell wall biosynthesis